MKLGKIGSLELIWAVEGRRYNFKIAADDCSLWYLAELFSCYTEEKASRAAGGIFKNKREI